MQDYNDSDEGPYTGNILARNVERACRVCSVIRKCLRSNHRQVGIIRPLLCRCLADPGLSVLFAFSSSNHILGGNLWVVVMVLISILSGWFAEQMRRYRDD